MFLLTNACFEMGFIRHTVRPFISVTLSDTGVPSTARPEVGPGSRKPRCSLTPLGSVLSRWGAAVTSRGGSGVAFSRVIRAKGAREGTM